MKFITDSFVQMWNDTSLVEKLFFAFVLIMLMRHVHHRLTFRCPECGGRFRKIHPDTTIWERITDMLTPTWQYERDYSPGVFECTGCQYRTKYLIDKLP